MTTTTTKVPLKTGQQSEYRVHERRCVLQIMKEAALRVGRAAQKDNRPVFDHQIGNHGHATSSVDLRTEGMLARQLQKSFQERCPFDSWVLDVESEDRTESITDGHTLSMNGRVRMRLIADPLDGTTNFKRRKANEGRGPQPQTAIVMAMQLYPLAPHLDIGVVHTLDDQTLWSALRIEKDAYIACRNDIQMSYDAAIRSRGDSKARVIVAAYSSHNYRAEAQLKDQLHKAGGFGMDIYGGCRSSAVDIISILNNQYDLYIDCRAAWTKDMANQSVLRIYDVAGAVPIALGCGLKVVLADGHPFSVGGLPFDEPVALIVGRPALVDAAVEALAPCIREWLS